MVWTEFELNWTWTASSVQSSEICLNWTKSPVLGSGKKGAELDWTELWHHYSQLVTPARRCMQVLAGLTCKSHASGSQVLRRCSQVSRRCLTNFSQVHINSLQISNVIMATYRVWRWWYYTNYLYNLLDYSLAIVWVRMSFISRASARPYMSHVTFFSPQLSLLSSRHWGPRPVVSRFT